jgi:type I restriction enzyme M protein
MTGQNLSSLLRPIVHLLRVDLDYKRPFDRHQYRLKPPRPLTEIDADLKVVNDRILTMIGELTQ